MALLKTRRWLLASLALAGAPAPVLASGITFGENGVRALSQGGAFVGQADDVSALQHNPAGLTQLRGFSFLVDGQLLNHEVGYSRQDAGGSAPASVNAIENQAGPFLLPFAGVSYGLTLWHRALTVAAGVYGPPAVGHYQYPEPNYERLPRQATSDPARFAEDPRKFAPQRYHLIENDVLILYPSLAVGYRLHPRVSVGGTFQYAWARMIHRRAIYSGQTTPKRQLEESPDYDSVVTVDLTSRPVFTGILGVLYSPLDRLSFGASIRPPVTLATEGTFTAVLGEFATQVNATVEGDRTSLDLNLPLEARVGARWQATQALGLNLDFVYEGWQSMPELWLKLQDIVLKTQLTDPAVLADVHIPKSFQHTWSARAGGSYELPWNLTVRAGVLFEQSASPDALTNLDFAHFTRVFLTGGLGYRYLGYEVLAGGAFVPTQTRTVTDSQLRQVNTEPSIAGGVVGNGTYSSGGWVANLGVRGNLGGQ